MHKDPPPGFFDARRPVAHVITHGLIAGFILALIAHFGWSLWRQNSGAVPTRPTGSDALVTGLNDAKGMTPAASPPTVRY